jgi:hypothetical protein
MVRERFNDILQNMRYKYVVFHYFFFYVYKEVAYILAHDTV